jgi:mono/diheme cytochrome c family protein
MRRKLNCGVFMIYVVLILATGCSAAGGDEEQRGTAQQGEKLFHQATIDNQPGCATCHSLESGVTIVGPSLAGIGSLAGGRVSGLSAEEYLRQSILEPNVQTVGGFTTNIMPAWSDKLTKEQVGDLVAYLLTLK